MPVVNQQIVDNIVKQLKSQGIFDQFRRDCLADVDTKPSYQNLRQRVEGYVSKFLSQQTWNPSLNKNQLRDELRRQINESGMLSIGVEHVVDQIVNSKANRVFLPQIEIAARRYLGLDRDQNDNEDNEQIVKDEKDTEKVAPDVKDSQNVVKESLNSQLKEVPSQITVQDKAQDTVTQIEGDKENSTEFLETVCTKRLKKEYDSYVILNTSRETETTISGDDDLLPPGVDFTSPLKKVIESEELIEGEDTSSSFNSEPLVIYDPQASSNENSSELSCSNKGSSNEEKSESTVHQPNLDFKKKANSSEASFDDLLQAKASCEVAMEVELKIPDETEVKAASESKLSVELEEKKSLESEIKKLLELGDKEKMEQEIRRILEIESKKMVEKELKKRESIETAKVQCEDGKLLSLENSRSNSLTDLTKEKSKAEKSKDFSSKSENLSRSNSSSDISKDKQASKSDKSKSTDVSSKSSSKHDSSNLKGHKSSHYANNRNDSKSSKTLSKSTLAKGKLEQKSESKTSSDKAKSSTKPKSSSSGKPNTKLTPKSNEVSKPKPTSVGGATKGDISSKVSKPELQTIKEKSRFVPVKANIVKPVTKHSLNTAKDVPAKTPQEKDKRNEKDESKKGSATKLKSTEKKDSQSHIFKSPDNHLSPEKKVEIESSETDDDFMRSLNNTKKDDDRKEDEDKKSDVSVSSVHTSDLSSFDDEISLSSDEELKAAPIPSPLKETKKIPLKDIKEITTTITKQGSGRNTPIPAEDVEKRVDPYQSVDDSSSQREDLTSETQTDDDDKGRRSGLRRQRKLNPKYASDEYSSIFNKTRRERKSTDDSKQSRSQNNTDPFESRKRRYSRTQERQSSKGDSESETSVKSSRIDAATSKSVRGRQSR